MLKVRVIKKFHDEKGILLGYTIQDTTGATRNVYKEQLKQAVKSGAVDCVNMTLTSDGRLIGKAAPEPKKKEKEEISKGSGVRLLEVYTNGRNIVGGMVDQSILDRETGVDLVVTGKLPAHINFEVGHELKKLLTDGYYDNVKIVNGKPDTTEVKRKSFSKVRDKLIKILKEQDAIPEFEVEKTDEKFNYSIVIKNFDSNVNKCDVLAQIVYCLAEDKFITDGITVQYIDEDRIAVKCLSGIAEVRKSIKKII